MDSGKVLKIVNDDLYLEKLKPCCYFPFLSGIIRGCAELIFTPKGFAMYFQSSDDKLIQLVKEIINKLIDEDFQVEKSYIDKGYLKGYFYTLNLPVENAQTILEKCKIIENRCEIIDKIPSELVAKTCCKSAYLRGLFLSCGTLSTPPEAVGGMSGKTKAGYHLEFGVNSEVVREDIKNLLTAFAQVKKSQIGFRTKKSGIYVKTAEAICNILAAMGSNNGVIAVQQIITSREMKNQVNRASNFVLANINKSISAGEKQLEAIKRIEETIGLDSLPPTIKEVAYLRMNNLDATLNELALMCVPPSTKSAINHRLRKLVQTASEIIDTKE
ncbi:MAG TPA: DNA-binding protein WhiA [Clostridia bacterium]|nr:DNA-binding protein WhiA [Clostridia bacterium]